MYSSHINAAIYSYFNFILSEKYESFLSHKKINETVTAYRELSFIDAKGIIRKKCNIHFAKDVFDEITKRGECVVVTTDITGFFDNLNHQILKKSICDTLGVNKLNKNFFKVYRSLTHYRYIDYESVFNTKDFKVNLRNNKGPLFKFLNKYYLENKLHKGIPQGSPISGLLANIYMLDFDVSIEQVFPDVFYRRYSDDLVFVCSKEELDVLLKHINTGINENKLNISPEKTFISYFKIENELLKCVEVTNKNNVLLRRNYLDYLGFEYYGDKVLLRKSSIGRLKKKQTSKVRKKVLNVDYSYKVKKRIHVNRQSRYFKISMRDVEDPSLKKQIVKVGSLK